MKTGLRLGLVGEGSHLRVVMARSRFAQLLQETRARGENN